MHRHGASKLQGEISNCLVGADRSALGIGGTRGADPAGFKPAPTSLDIQYTLPNNYPAWLLDF